jgi:hypothetical protein
LNKIMREKFNGGIKETNEKVNSLWSRKWKFK